MNCPIRTRKENIADTIHGIRVEDPYRWLENVDDLEVKEWVEKQNKRTKSAISQIPARTELEKRFTELFRMDTIGFPVPRNGRYFSLERKAEEDLGVLYVQEGLRGEPRTLVNPNLLSPDKTISLRSVSISRDGKFVAYTLSEAANDMAALYVMDVDTGQNLPDVIPGEIYPSVHSGIEWAHDASGFWYTHRHPDAPPEEVKFHQKLYYHKLGEDWREDPLVFGEQIEKENIPSATPSADGRYLLVTVFVLSEERERTEIYLKDLQNPNEGFVAIVTGIKDAMFFGDIHREMLYVATNHEASCYKIIAAPVGEARLGLDKFRTIIPESEAGIEGMNCISDKMYLTTLENVHSRLYEYDLQGNLKRELPLPTLGSCGTPSGEPEGNEAFFNFTSFAVPITIYRIDLEKNKIALFKQAGAGIDTSRIETKQIWCASKDGTKVPIFLVHKKGLPHDGQRPTVLYGYGGFNNSLTPSFMKTIVPLIEHGGIFAIANIRGGGEFGEEWHRAGTREKKQNVFDDFISAAEYLITQGYTDREKLAIEGGSNGGLLVGAVITQRPNLVRAAVMVAPVTDMARFPLFFGGRHWIPDYGSVEEPGMAPVLLSYSPYHNIKDCTEYPSVLVTTSEEDDRVHPSHSYKIVARLQEAQAGPNPVFLRVETKAGHGGAEAVSPFIEKEADTWSFIFSQLGIS